MTDHPAEQETRDHAPKEPTPPQAPTDQPTPDVPTDGQDRAEAPEPVADRQARRDTRWRDRAQAAEARAERLATREVLRLLGDRVSDPQAALALSGADIGDLLDDGGDVDAQAVADLAEKVAAAHTMLRPVGHHLDLGPRATPVRRREASWGSIIRGR